MGTTPTLGFPFPEDTDPVAQGAAAIEALALAVDEAVSDAPRGVLAYAEITGVIGGFGSSESDVAGLSVSPTVAAGRRIRVRSVALLSATSTSARKILRVHQDGVQIQSAEIVAGNTTDGETVVCERILTPTAGVHTYKARVIVTAGGSTGGVNASAPNPAFIVVEDLGAV